MYAQILAGLLLVPFGLWTLMRGSDGLNVGAMGPGEAGTLAISGAIMVLSGVGLMLGLVVVGVSALAAMVAASAVWLRQRSRALGRRPRPSEMAGRALWACAIVALIFMGWR